MSQNLVSAEKAKKELDLFFENYPGKRLEFFLWPTVPAVDDFFHWLTLVNEAGQSVFLVCQSDVTKLLSCLDKFFKPFFKRTERGVWLDSYYCELGYKEGMPRVVVYKDLRCLAEKVHQRIEQHQELIRQAYNALAEDKNLLIEIAYKAK